MSVTKQQRAILVTGANKGIGFHVVQKLLKDSSPENTIILLGSRDRARGEEALKKLGHPSNVHLIQLDMSSTDSIQQTVNEIQTKYPDQLEIVINNAGVALRELNVEAARKSFAVHYYGIKLLNELLYPLIRENGRIINVSSQGGPILLNETSKELQERYTSSSLAIGELDLLVEQFISAVETNTLADIGYHCHTYPPVYGISKVALNALTQIEAREWAATKNLLVIAVTPGYCATDMTFNAATARSPELGADSILHAVYTPREQLVNGGFYRDGNRLPLISV